MRFMRAILIALLTVSIQAQASAQADFRRGDANVDGVVDIADAGHIFTFLWLGGFPGMCRDALAQTRLCVCVAAGGASDWSTAGSTMIFFCLAIISRAIAAFSLTIALSLSIFNAASR